MSGTDTTIVGQLREESLVLECPDLIVLCRVDLLNATLHGKDVGAVDDLRMRQCAANQRCQGGEDWWKGGTEGDGCGREG